MIGYFSYLIINREEIRLDNLFLYQDFIGKGFGKLLIEYFLDKAKKLQPEFISLEAEPNAENFYKKFSFFTFDQKESAIKNRFLPQMKLIF